MKVLIASPEAVPFAKTGGLADVAGVLVDELKRIGIDSSIILPFYRRTKDLAKDLRIKELGKEFTISLGNDTEKGRLWKGKTARGADAYFIENDRFYDRDELYGTDEGDYPDNASRFIFYSRGVIETIKKLDLKVDIIHCNDWQSGLIPVYLKTIYSDEFHETATLMTIHNIGYQGLFWYLDMPLTGLGWEMFRVDALEFYGKINFLKGGILFADIITTVSSTYAKEIMTSEYGFGLDGVLRGRRQDLYGVLNGIDYNEWSPWRDRLIPARYNKKNTSGKALCKNTLRRECNLTESDRPLMGMVSRLSSQKGIDLVAEAMDKIIKSSAQVIILGRGEKIFHEIFSELQKRHKGNLSVIIGFDNALAHKIYAGSDIFLMPSKYEPCGLGQLVALSYGTIPIVRRTGGLADTITEYNPNTGEGTGFLFDDYSVGAMLSAITRAKELFDDKIQWQRLMFNAMSMRFTWRQSARQYLTLYRKALKRHQDKGI